MPVSQGAQDEPVDRRHLGEEGPCEAWDWMPIRDDAVYLRCVRRGRVIRETGPGIDRHRCVCVIHGLATAMNTH